MRVNARFEGVSEKQVEYLVKTTGRTVSEVLRDSVARYYAELHPAGGGGLQHFGKMVGKGRSGRSDVSVTYKQQLTRDWDAKQGLSPGPGQAGEP